MFQLSKEEVCDVSGGFYSILDNAYVIVSNYGISDRCFLIIDNAFGNAFNGIITTDQAAQVTYYSGCNYESMQYNENVHNGFYYAILA